jgi:hypothetical protein
MKQPQVSHSHPETQKSSEWGPERLWLAVGRTLGWGAWVMVLLT